MEQLRLQRIQQRVQQQQQEAQSLGVSEVNPEFLAALPPNIQEEVRNLSRWMDFQHKLTLGPLVPSQARS